LAGNGLDTKKGTENGGLETHLRLESFGMFFLAFFLLFFLLIFITFSTGLRCYYRHARGAAANVSVRSGQIPGLRGNGDSRRRCVSSPWYVFFSFFFFLLLIIVPTNSPLVREPCVSSPLSLANAMSGGFFGFLGQSPRQKKPIAHRHHHYDWMKNHIKAQEMDDIF
jgi:hypothetical protein